jgi:iron complex transport system substrate-binding protein
MHRIALVVMMAWLSSSVWAAFPLSATDVRGVKVSLSSPPRRIVSLTPANTEILFALGLRGRIVGVTAYCNYPPEAKQLPRVGDVHISVEKVLALRPDLVVVSASASRKAIERLESLRGSHVPLFATDPRDFAGLYRDIRALGHITGQVRQAEALILSIRRRVERVRKFMVSSPAKPRVLYVLQADPLWVAGSANFIDELIHLARAENIARDAGPGYCAYSTEKVIMHDPEIILTTEETASRLPSLPGWSRITAVRRKAIYVLGEEAVRPGPRLVNALERLVKLLHPTSYRKR